MVVTPAVRARQVLATEAGKPIMKSPMWGWMAEAWPSWAQSSGPAIMGPVSAGTRFQ